MRMRRKAWARPELAVCPFFIDKAEENKGKWKSLFKRKQPMHLELGCGKGDFISEIAATNADINYIAVDIKSEVLACARRNIVKEFEEINRDIDNVILVAQDIERISSMLDKNDVIDRIYINFCNPWPKKKHKKRRLTYPRQLELYKAFLKDNGEIYFKTDDDNLFEESIEYFLESGFEILYKTIDLHSENLKDNILTEHEKMFMAEGIKIKALIARKK